MAMKPSMGKKHAVMAQMRADTGTTPRPGGRKTAKPSKPVARKSARATMLTKRFTKKG